MMLFLLDSLYSHLNQQWHRKAQKRWTLPLRDFQPSLVEDRHFSSIHFSRKDRCRHPFWMQFSYDFQTSLLQCWHYRNWLNVHVLSSAPNRVNTTEIGKEKKPVLMIAPCSSCVWIKGDKHAGCNTICSQAVQTLLIWHRLICSIPSASCRNEKGRAIKNINQGLKCCMIHDSREERPRHIKR